MCFHTDSLLIVSCQIPGSHRSPSVVPRFRVQNHLLGPVQVTVSRTRSYHFSPGVLQRLQTWLFPRGWLGRRYIRSLSHLYDVLRVPVTEVTDFDTFFSESNSHRFETAVEVSYEKTPLRTLDSINEAPSTFQMTWNGQGPSTKRVSFLLLTYSRSSLNDSFRFSLTLVYIWMNGVFTTPLSYWFSRPYTSHSVNKLSAYKYTRTDLS